ncbi:hypothetical protein BHE74_00009181 [Ensete ventricosum]|nr:hypothetical protein BHE74_00009181 [Ensete ventricosum]
MADELVFAIELMSSLIGLPAKKWSDDLFARMLIEMVDAHGNSNLAILYVLVPDGVSRSRVAKTIVLDPIHSLRRLTGSQLFLPSLLTDLGLLKP